MSSATTGVLIGAVLALTAIILGFWAFVFVAIAMAIGWAAGRVASGDLDLRSLAESLRGRRSS
ncbi:DUF2273 domain-containing protein [Herbiconiux sp. CPCC 205716]|uniref:DUF2273 domain-containing protein n=1 Tax=Herbiconiux gentiana TaxID=2970912 RepID=A0ABT2GHI9_9MICO|nr:DUF2273 domain-containing protein [Herbiconiux gentiana]MCS5715683.1 DUF2273 domain-containing protein [Herbiconiux gentiana]